MNQELVSDVLIGLGSNLSSPKQQINNAIQEISLIDTIEVHKTSSLYESIPQGPQDQDKFINAVTFIKTSLTPTELLTALQKIEHRFGRKKTRHWGERIIDLDIIFFNQDIINQSSPDLTIPHPQALIRDFVLIPAIEIAADWELPNGTRLKSLVHQCVSHQLNRILP